MASTIRLKNSTGSGAAPSTLAQGEAAINILDGSLFFGTAGGTAVSSSFKFTNVTATRFIQGETNISSIYSPIGGGSGIVTTGTIETGTWNGTVIASAYLDTDTAHLTTDQTFTGRKSFTTNITSSRGISASLASSSSFGRLDTTTAHISSTAGIYTDKIRRFSDSSNTTKILLNDEVIKFNAGHSSNETLKLEQNTVTATGNITASGDISSSGDFQTAYTGSFGHVLASSVSGIQSGKNYRIINASFRDDIATTKHYVPLKSQDEQVALTREEGTELAVCDGRLVSATVRVENMNGTTGDFTLTMGVETNTVGTNYTTFDGTSETEALTVNTGDDHHLFHFVFSTAKHWDATDMFAVSIQSDSDEWGTNERFFVTLVIEDDWSTYLAGLSREIDSTP
jgi:hypothetical protein